MLIPLEILLLMFSFFFIGFSHARRCCFSTMILAVVFWLLATYTMYFINLNPFPPHLPSIPQENAVSVIVIGFVLVLIAILLFFGIPYLAGYYVGTVVNNVEKYQRK